MTAQDDWQEDDPAARPTAAEDTLILDIQGFEGPLDLLLNLARTQKVDLSKISILELVEQYLAFIAEARRIQIELAADYLVMAAWLAYLKSRLLLPQEETAEEPSGEEMAARLQFQLMRLEAMRERAAQLMSRHRLGRDVFPRGQPEGLRMVRHSKYDLTLYELLRAYALTRQRADANHLTVTRPPVYAIEDLLHRLEPLMGGAMDWTVLEQFLPPEAQAPRQRRSALATSFAAALELTKQGKIELRQAGAFAPLYVRRRRGNAHGNPAGDGDTP